MSPKRQISEPSEQSEISDLPEESDEPESSDSSSVSDPSLPAPDEGSPKTGDSSGIALILSASALSLIAAALAKKPTDK